MSRLEQNKNDKIYLKIVQGTLRQSVPEGTQGSIARPWEAGGKKGVSHEIEHTAIFGKIIEVGFFEGEHDGRKFTNLQITLDENEDGKKPVISVGSQTRYAEDFMKKLPNVNFEEEVRIRPFSFTPEGEERIITGVEITHRDNQDKFTKKVDNFFYDKANKKALNGYPTPTEEIIDNSDWELFYKQANRFLVKHTKDNIIPKFQKKTWNESLGEVDPSLVPEEEAKPEDIPF